ncbi:hypothetical protein AGMMS49957_17200 [Synergistales bacterium]|nr:hypothetical protein AGMMS49957_17200 [Synergistales bacterium]
MKDREGINVVLCNFVVFALVFLMLRTSFEISLVLVAAVVVSLLYMEKRGVIDKLFSLYTRNKKLAVVSALFFALLIPLLLATLRYQSHIAVMAVICTMVCCGVNIQMGSTNMVNFAPAAFMGIGAYSLGYVTVKLGASPWLGLLAAVVLCVMAGLLLGLPTLRTKGYYLSLVTMALQLAFTQTIKNMPSIGGPNGLSGVKALTIAGYPLYKTYTLFGVRLAPHFFYLIFCILARGHALRRKQDIHHALRPCAQQHSAGRDSR